ncbi:hypothetical protein ACHAXT_005694 [Thalassiosira profunda]
MELSSGNANALSGEALLSSMGGGALPAVLFLLASVAIFLHRRRRKSAVKYPPRAPGGWLQQMYLRLSGTRSAYWMYRAACDLETEVMQIQLTPFMTVFAVGELKLFREILTDPRTKKPERLYGYFRGTYGGESSIFTSADPDGAEWHAKRKACAPAFSSGQIRRMTRVALDKTEAWIQNKLLRCYSFDVAEEMIGIVLSALSETAFEYEMTQQEKKVFGKELSLLLIEYCRKTPVIPFRDRLGWLFKDRRRTVTGVKRLKKMVFKIMEEWRAKENPIQGTIIQLIMDNSEAFPTDESKAAQLLEEALRKRPSEKWSSCEELQRVVEEGLRLHPVGRSIRKIGKDFYTAKGEMIPKGSVCILHFQMMHRNKHIFEDPDTFKPSRWQNPTRDMLDAVNPFSLGRQNCIGQSLAKAETFGIIAHLLSQFELSIESEGYVNFFLTVKPAEARLRARRM